MSTKKTNAEKATIRKYQSNKEKETSKQVKRRNRKTFGAMRDKKIVLENAIPALI